MEKISLKNDINVLCVKAETFGDGVLKAHQTLQSLVPFLPSEIILVYPEWRAEKLWYVSDTQVRCMVRVI